MISNRRWFFVLVFILLAVLVLIIKLILINTVEHKFLKREGDNRVERVIQKHAFRGAILDRNGYPLAVSTPVDSIWVNPLNVDYNGQKFNKAMQLLDISDKNKGKILNRIRLRAGKSGFVYLKRQVNPIISAKIEKMNILGVHLKREYKRYYPDGEVVSHILGFVDIDNKGKEGIELIFNTWLDGDSGYQHIWKDGKGNKARLLSSSKQPKHGKDIRLSVDRNIQYIAYKALKKGVISNKAKAGSAVVMDIKTGEVLAMVNQPSYNPNDLSKSDIFKRRNRAVTDVFEPGSVIKTFAALAAVKSGKFTSSSMIDTSPGYFYIGNNVVRDTRNYGDINLGYILLKSSNVGISRAVLELQPEVLPNTLNEFGFGKRTGIEFPGERSGYVPLSKKLDDFSLATLSFGYGMNLTTLQLSKAYATIANKGKMTSPTFLFVNGKVDNKEIVTEEIADQIREMLLNVVEGKDSRSKAKIWGYHVAGKTGTTHKSAKGGYSKNDYIAVFAGFAPATNPRLMVVVMVDDPEGEYYYGGSVSAPIFSEIMSRSLRVLNIKLDKDFTK
jgi:cell division protein FtsI (penicillin-binding protein 3)